MLGDMDQAIPARPAVSAESPFTRTMTTQRLMVAIAFISIFAVATGVSIDSDTWWHLHAGEWMARHHQILTRDPFSWTRAGALWINHSWLSQILMFSLWKMFGFAGLNVAVAALVTTAFLFVYLQCEGSVYLKAIALQLAAFSAGVYWPARPQIVSLVLASTFAYVLSLFRWRSVNRLWLLPALMVLWVNAHGGFVVGLLLVAMTLGGQVLSRVLGQRGPGVVDWRGIMGLAGAGVACAAVVPLNPYGAQMLSYPLRTISIGALQDLILEWKSPNFHLLGTQGFIWLVLAILAAVALSRKRIDLTDLVLLSGFIYLALLSVRNIPLFALVGPVVLTRHAAAGLADLRERRLPLAVKTSARAWAQRPSAALNWILLVTVLLAGLVKTAIPLRVSANDAAIARSMPVAAVEYLRKAGPPGPLFNSYNWGGYLAWTLHPAYPVYVDGRTDLYGDKFLREYLRIAMGQDEWRDVFARERIRLVVIETESPLAAELRYAPNWKQAYADPLASVFVRR